MIHSYNLYSILFNDTDTSFWLGTNFQVFGHLGIHHQHQFDVECQLVFGVACSEITVLVNNYPDKYEALLSSETPLCFLLRQDPSIPHWNNVGWANFHRIVVVAIVVTDIVLWFKDRCKDSLSPRSSESGMVVYSTVYPWGLEGLSSLVVTQSGVRISYSPPTEGCQRHLHHSLSI